MDDIHWLGGGLMSNLPRGPRESPPAYVFIFKFNSDADVLITSPLNPKSRPAYQLRHDYLNDNHQCRERGMWRCGCGCVMCGCGCLPSIQPFGIQPPSTIHHRHRPSADVGC
eukprot:scaffold102_cov133-Isochrysis_galbana.AAC.6